MIEFSVREFAATEWGDGCVHYERADGWLIDWFAIPPSGGPLAVLCNPAGGVVGYYGGPEEAAAAAPQMAVAS